MNAAAEERSIGFQENKMTALRDSADQMRNPGMTERFASSDPNNRRAAANDVADLFMRDRMAGIGMQNLCRIHELHGANAPRGTQPLCEPRHNQVRGQPQGEAHHAL